MMPVDCQSSTQPHPAHHSVADLSALAWNSCCEPTTTVTWQSEAIQGSIRRELTKRKHCANTKRNAQPLPNQITDKCPQPGIPGPHASAHRIHLLLRLLHQHIDLLLQVVDVSNRHSTRANCRQAVHAADRWHAAQALAGGQREAVLHPEPAQVC